MAILLNVAATPLLITVRLSIEQELKVLIIAVNERLRTSVVAVVTLVLAVAPVTFVPFCCKVNDTSPATGTVNVAVTDTR